MNHFIVGILFSFGFFVFSPLTARATIIFSADYTDGTFGNVAVRKAEPGAGYPSLAYQPPKGHSAQIVTAPSRSGSKAVKMTLLPTDEGYLYGKYQKAPYVRAEFEKQDLDYRNLERWFAFSVYIDPSYTDTTNDPNGAVISQWGVIEDACDKDNRPPLMIRYKETTNQWLVWNDFDTNACSTTTSITKKRIVAGTATKGVWTDWVVNVRWSLKADGFLKIWKDGKLVVNETGPNVLNHQNTKMLWKWGVYKSWYRSVTPPATDKLIVYFNEIKIGDANSGYAAVAPQNSQPASLAAPVNSRIIKD